MSKPIEFKGDSSITAYLNGNDVRLTESCKDGQEKSSLYNEKTRKFDINSGKYFDVVTLSLEQFREVASYLRENGIEV